MICIKILLPHKNWYERKYPVLTDTSVCLGFILEKLTYPIFKVAIPVQQVSKISYKPIKCSNIYLPWTKAFGLGWRTKKKVFFYSLGFWRGQQKEHRGSEWKKKSPAFWPRLSKYNKLKGFPSFMTSFQILLLRLRQKSQYLDIGWGWSLVKKI